MDDHTIERHGALDQHGLASVQFGDIVGARLPQTAEPTIVQPNPFRVFWDLGYRRLVPIVPPDAELSPRSSLSKNPGCRGKAVGVRSHDGWTSYNWTKHEATEDDLDRWHTTGAGVGIKMGEQRDGTWLLGIDADTLNREWAAIIAEDVFSRFGVPPKRIGKAPKALYLIRVDAEVRYTRAEFGELNERGTLAERVEILAEGRQAVVSGVHPGTRQPYRWTESLVPFDELPVGSAAAVADLLEAVAGKLPKGRVQRPSASADSAPPQETLQGDPDLVRKAIAATPNTSAICPSRDDYVKYGIAVKAALAGQPDAFNVWWDWCERWTDGAPNYDFAVGDWQRMKPPFRVGASYVYELADKHSGGEFDRAEVWFDQAAADYTPLFPTEGPSPHDLTVGPKLFDLYSEEDVESMPDPVFLIDRHIPEQSLGFLYGAPGARKSFVALDWAMHVAYGRDTWHGDAIRSKPNGAVIYLAGEGAQGVKHRLAAWRKHHAVPDGARGRFRLLKQGVDFMQPDDVRRLAATLREKILKDGACVALLVVDTVSRAMPGADENLQKEMTLFVKNCDVLREEFDCCVLGVHHANRDGDMRGSTVLLGAGDFVFKLERSKTATMGLLTCEKQKDAPDGWKENYRFDVVGVGDGKSSLVPTRVEGAVVTALTPERATAVFDAIAAAWDAKEPWSKHRRAGERWAAKRMADDHGFPLEEAGKCIEFWLGSGALGEGKCDKKSNKRGLRVVSYPGQLVSADTGLFD